MPPKRAGEPGAPRAGIEGGPHPDEEPDGQAEADEADDHGEDAVDVPGLALDDLDARTLPTHRVTGGGAADGLAVGVGAVQVLEAPWRGWWAWTWPFLPSAEI